MTDHDDIESWLNRLGEALQPLPETEREDIVGETRGHLEERLSAGLTSTSALAGFGRAEAYARAFLDDHALTQALDSRRSLAMARVLFDLAGRSLVATLGLIGFVVFSATMLAALGCILVKIIKPDLIGLWSGPTGFALGATDHAGMHDVLGNGVYLVLALLVVVDAVLARLSLITAVKGVKSRDTAVA
jgi:uncharacterized membrane protein